MRRPSRREVAVALGALAAVVVVMAGGGLAFVAVARFFAEGPFGFAIENESDELLIVDVTQVGATSGRTYKLAPEEIVSSSVSRCGSLDIVVTVKEFTERVATRDRLEVCEGERVVIDQGFDLSVE